jgi:hypothetical protein
MDRRTNDPALVPYPQNAKGDFYVVNEECITCGAPEAEAPMLMSHDGESHHCFFARQPSTEADTDAAILSTWVACCGSVRYGGQDREILIRLAELGVAHSCDYKLDDEPKPVSRNRATFEFGNPEARNTGRASAARQIMEYLAGEVTAKPRSDHRVVQFQCSDFKSSFRYEWGSGGPYDPCSATYTLEPFGGHHWTLRVSRETSHPTTGCVIMAHRAMQRDVRFRNARWFTEEEWQRDTGEGRLLPY